MLLTRLSFPAVARRSLSTQGSIQAARALNTKLDKSSDPELYDILEKEKQRQKNALVLIASENYAPRRVFDALGTVMSNKYSEGYPGARYYAGNQYVDDCERLCQKRALKAFGLDEKEWGVNVQSLSGSPANFQVYAALLKPHDRLMGLDLPHGGHLSHGFYNTKRKVSATSLFFESMPYRLDEKTHLIDYDTLEKNAMLFRPSLIIAGSSAYPRIIDHDRMRQICDKVGAVLMCDIAHVSGLVAGQAIPSPFKQADVVTTTTHKSLRGPRGAMIFYRKTDRATGKPTDLQERIDFSVFPGLQGGPHNHTIAALASALKLCVEPEFKQYQQQVVKNARALAEALGKRGYKIVSGGTDNHLIPVDVKASAGVDGARTEKVLDMASIITNKNTVPGDTSALIPGGVRLGTPAVTTRGATEEDMEKVAEFFDRAVKITKTLVSKMGDKKKLAEFKDMLNVNSDVELKEKFPEIAALRKDVEAFASAFPTIGYEVEEMVYKDRFT